MKYMGSKRAMLQNGLGALLAEEVKGANRFVDLFTGSAAVAAHVAEKHEVPVLAVDLQQFSAVLAEAVIGRKNKLEWKRLWRSWHGRARAQFRQKRLPASRRLTRGSVEEFRSWCFSLEDSPISKAYGGHYFSPEQARWIDCLRKTLPRKELCRTAALAALVQAASLCVASPGHTAQPFQPTRTGKLYLEEQWSKDLVKRTKDALRTVASRYAMKRGRAESADANQVAKRLRGGDLVFVDPPYSAVQYSRFYHVLESIVRGECGEASGVGRYPAAEARPHSTYSLKTRSAEALDDLLSTVASRDARAILTFPVHECSNGLSGETVRNIALRYFQVEEQIVQSRFSTLGGKGDEREDEAGRATRHDAAEMILVLEPR